MNIRNMIVVADVDGHSRYVFDINEIEYIRECVTPCYEIGLKSGLVIGIKQETYSKLYHAFLDDDDE